MKQPKSFVNADDRNALRESVRDARVALSKIFNSAHLLREETLVPSWDVDLNDPAHVINNAICFVEECLGLDHEDAEEPTEGGAS